MSLTAWMWLHWCTVSMAGSAAPVECSCRPTSNDSLSVRDLDVFKQVRYWGREKKQVFEHRGENIVIDYCKCVFIKTCICYLLSWDWLLTVLCVKFGLINHFYFGKHLINHYYIHKNVFAVKYNRLRFLNHSQWASCLNNPTGKKMDELSISECAGDRTVVYWQTQGKERERVLQSQK